MRCSLPIRSGQVGDVDSGDDWADPTGAFPQGKDHQGDRAGPEGVPEHGPQGAAVGGDIVRIRTLGSALGRSWAGGRRTSTTCWQAMRTKPAHLVKFVRSLRGCRWSVLRSWTL